MQLAPATYSGFFAVTASDTTQINCRALYINCTVTGNLVISTAPSGAGVTFPIAVGTFVLPIALDAGRILATGNTATATIVGLQ